MLWALTKSGKLTTSPRAQSLDRFESCPTTNIDAAPR
jgi:hypothetical protein